MTVMKGLQETCPSGCLYYIAECWANRLMNFLGMCSQCHAMCLCCP